MSMERVRSKTARANRPGFTLLEVMIALAVGGIALGSMYAVGSASTRHFREQQRISATQTSLRTAMDILKHDFQRAGFLSTPSAAIPGESCYAVPSLIDNSAGHQLAAVAGYIKGAQKPESLDPNQLNASRFYTVDQVWLTGNYATSGEYPGISIAADNVTVTIPMAWQSFQRDFTNWQGTNAGVCQPEAFNAAFPVGRLVRLHGLNERNFYTRVRSTTCTNTVAAVVIQDAVPSFCNVEGGWIAPVNTLRYAVVDAAADEGSRVGINRVSVLRRTEVQPGARTQALRDTAGEIVEDRGLLDYVVNFNVGFMLGMGDGTSRVVMMPVADTALFANRERVRGVILDLAARTPEHEPEFSSDVPAAAFRVYDTVGAARVRRAHAELLLPNIAYRGL
jgi:prepilin-type N-terminal cleavage/methylation domain-containing protein